jgi:transposase
VFEKLLQACRFGCSYEAIADSTCGATTIRNRRDEWIRAGIFAGLATIAREAYDRIVACCCGTSPSTGASRKRPAAASAPGAAPLTEVNRA